MKVFLVDKDGQYLCTVSNVKIFKDFFNFIQKYIYIFISRTHSVKEAMVFPTKGKSKCELLKPNYLAIIGEYYCDMLKCFECLKNNIMMVSGLGKLRLKNTEVYWNMNSMLFKPDWCLFSTLLNICSNLDM